MGQVAARSGILSTEIAAPPRQIARAREPVPGRGQPAMAHSKPGNPELPLATKQDVADAAVAVVVPGSAVEGIGTLAPLEVVVAAVEGVVAVVAFGGFS